MLKVLSVLSSLSKAGCWMVSVQSSLTSARMPSQLGSSPCEEDFKITCVTLCCTVNMKHQVLCYVLT
jgi:hypothetical protein